MFPPIITEEAFIELIKAIVVPCTQGSGIIFDYGDEGLFKSDVPLVKNMIAMAQAGGEPMITSWSYPELEQIMEKCGLLIYEHINHDEIQEAYFKNRTDYASAFEHINICFVVRY